VDSDKKVTKNCAWYTKNQREFAFTQKRTKSSASHSRFAFIHTIPQRRAPCLDNKGETICQQRVLPSGFVLLDAPNPSLWVVALLASLLEAGSSHSGHGRPTGYRDDIVFPV